MILVEKVDEQKDMMVSDGVITNIDKKSIYSIRMSQQCKSYLNKVISKHVTKDLFRKDKTGQKLFKFWKKSPVVAISYFDQQCKNYGFRRMKKSKDTNSPIIKMLLRITGNNKMEQLNNTILEQKKQIEDFNKEAKENHKRTKDDKPKEMKIVLPPSFIEEIELRSSALAEEDQYKQELIKKAQEKGWLGVTVEEVDLDLTENYRKIAKQIEHIKHFEKEDLELLKVMQSIRRDKMDIQKFQIKTQIELAKLEEKRKLREKVTGITLESLEEVA